MDIEFYKNYVGFLNPDKDRSILKDTHGRFKTATLFYETWKQRDQAEPIYTMREEEYKGLPSAYQIYMNSESEYEAAYKLVGSWNHWQKLLRCGPFMNGSSESSLWSGLKQWREEKATKDRALMYTLLKMQAASGNVAAQKILFEQGSKNTKGRPSKEQVEQAAKEAAQHETAIKDDLARIRLAVNNG